MFLVTIENMGNVEPYNCWDGVMNGATRDEELENILSILDFPMESLEADGLAGDWDASKSHYLGPIPSDDVLMGPPMIAHGKSDTRLLPVPVDVSKPSKMDATPEPKQPPYQYKDSSGFHIPPQNKCTEVKVQGVFQSQSPVSVLESSGSTSAGKSLLTRSHVCKRTRSRRARPSGVNPWFLRSPLYATSSASRKTSKSRRNKESRRKLSQLPHTRETMVYLWDRVDLQIAASQHPAVVKKCTHCEVTKTPQWREGPMGPKTLCNACGVRYRSGRLFPEYRPAASPTFMPSLHSNSHKKVVEMRSKAKQQVMKLNGIHAHG